MFNYIPKYLGDHVPKKLFLLIFILIVYHIPLHWKRKIKFLSPQHWTLKIHAPRQQSFQGALPQFINHLLLTFFCLSRALRSPLLGVVDGLPRLLNFPWENNCSVQAPNVQPATLVDHWHMDVKLPRQLNFVFRRQRFSLSRQPAVARVGSPSAH